MRIISGIYGGRNLEAPKNKAIRPTSGKVRGAIMNALGSLGAIDGADVLDGFCGTGALGIEALSRGAAGCLFIDSEREALNLARSNAALVGAQECNFMLKDLAKLPARPDQEPMKTLVFLDPPYGKDMLPGALAALVNGGWLAPQAICVLEEDKVWRAQVPPGFTILSDKNYGDTKVVITRVG
jgi:16S rRNA (guanine966-N2)-methyltransferase